MKTLLRCTLACAMLLGIAAGFLSSKVEPKRSQTTVASLTLPCPKPQQPTMPTLPTGPGRN